MATSFDHAGSRCAVELDKDDAGNLKKEKLKLKPGSLVLAERKGKGQ